MRSATTGLGRAPGRECVVVVSANRVAFIFAQQTVTTNAKRAARNFHGIDLALLHVVVNRTPINVDDLGRASHSYDLHVLVTARTPDFISENQGWLRHTLNLLPHHASPPGTNNARAPQLLPTWSRLLTRERRSVQKRLLAAAHSQQSIRYFVFT